MLKTKSNIIGELCEQAKEDLFYVCENNMKILVELSDDIISCFWFCWILSLFICFINLFFRKKFVFKYNYDSDYLFFFS